MNAIDEYLQNVPSSQRVVLEKIRRLITQLVPDAEEGIGYSMPAFKYKGKYLIYFAAFKDHLSIFPGTDTLNKDLDKKLAPFRTSKGTLQFTEDKPLPNELIKELVEFRKAEIIKDLPKSP